jgi:prephenate dehydratase
MKVAFQGEHGAFSEAALLNHFGEETETVPCPSFEQVFVAVESGAVDAGVLPIENSLGGSVLDNYDLLLEHPLPIVGELSLNVRHCLLGKPGTRLEDVQVAYSHPQALAQSMPFLKRHNIEARAAYDTAGAARELSKRDEPGAAAIASERAGKIYGLTVLAEGIQTRNDNTTRFFVVRRERPAGLPAEKASLVFAAPNAPGSLHRVLGAFERRGLNLTKIESRPTRGTPWEYHFYVDFEGRQGAAMSDGAIADLMAELTETLPFVRLLGTYPRARRGD